MTRAGFRGVRRLMDAVHAQGEVNPLRIDCAQLGSISMKFEIV